MKRKILIAGLGLIGGSLAKAIHQSNHYLIGYDPNEETLIYAKDQHIVDEVESNFIKAVKKADIVLLAAPITETIELLKKMDEITFQKEIIVSDVSSVKGSILDTANKLTNKN